MSEMHDGLAAHLRNGVTTLCHCWRLVRQDGSMMGFTDHDRTLFCDGTEFRPETGLAASEARASLDLAVDTVDVEGALSSLDIGEEDIVSGIYDGARIETLLVDWHSPQNFTVLRRVVVGKIERRDGSFVAELESQTTSLDKPNGRTIARKCDAELGDTRCKVDLDRQGFRATGVVLRVEGRDTLVVDGLRSHDRGWFSHGLLTWSSGAAAGRAERILSHRSRGDETLLVVWSEQLGRAEPGDAFSVVTGCDKLFSTCRAKFANADNFRGFPHLPGNDSAYAYVNADAVFDGGPLVP